MPFAIIPIKVVNKELKQEHSKLHSDAAFYYFVIILICEVVNLVVNKDANVNNGKE
jgi:hypothetical protein